MVGVRRKKNIIGSRALDIPINLNASRLCFLHFKKRSVPCSVPSNIRTGPTDAKKGIHYEKSKINKRKKKEKKIGPRKSDVAGDMLDKGDKQAIAPTRHAKRIKIKQRRRIKDHQKTREIARFYTSCTCCVIWFIMKKVVGTKFEPVLCCWKGSN